MKLAGATAVAAFVMVMAAGCDNDGDGTEGGVTLASVLQEQTDGERSQERDNEDPVGQVTFTGDPAMNTTADVCRVIQSNWQMFFSSDEFQETYPLEGYTDGADFTKAVGCQGYAMHGNGVVTVTLWEDLGYDDYVLTMTERLSNSDCSVEWLDDTIDTGAPFNMTRLCETPIGIADLLHLSSFGDTGIVIELFTYEDAERLRDPSTVTGWFDTVSADFLSVADLSAARPDEPGVPGLNCDPDNPIDQVVCDELVDEWGIQESTQCEKADASAVVSAPARDHVDGIAARCFVPFDQERELFAAAEARGLTFSGIGDLGFEGEADHNIFYIVSSVCAEPTYWPATDSWSVYKGSSPSLTAERFDDPVAALEAGCR